MKAILTMTMMLGLLITFADAHPLGEKRNGGVITEQEAKNFKKENNIQWRQIYSGERWENDPLAQQFNIRGVPAQWLIDRDGKLITHKARGEKLEQLVVEALKKE